MTSAVAETRTTALVVPAQPRTSWLFPRVLEAGVLGGALAGSVYGVLTSFVYVGSLVAQDLSGSSAGIGEQVPGWLLLLVTGVLIGAASGLFVGAALGVAVGPVVWFTGRTTGFLPWQLRRALIAAATFATVFAVVQFVMVTLLVGSDSWTFPEVLPAGTAALVAGAATYRYAGSMLPGLRRMPAEDVREPGPMAEPGVLV